MTREDGLKKLFKAEIDRMNDLMDDIVTAAKATGSHDNPGHLEADLTSGWTFRLLERFGTAMNLSFKNDCAGRQFLAEHSVPDDFIPVIAETYQQERKFARSTMFENALKQEMEDVGLNITRLNLERARSETFRAKADVLLNTRSLYPIAFRDNANDQSLTKAAAQDAPLKIVKASEEDVSPEASVGDDDQLPNEKKVSGPEAQQQETASDPVQDDELAAGNRQVLLPVSQFMDIFEIWKRNKGEGWTAETARDARNAVRMFTEVLEKFNVVHTGQIRQAHLAAFRDFLGLLPKNYGQSTRMRALTAPELEDIGLKLLDEADDETDAKVGLAAATVRKHMTNLQSFRDVLASRGHTIIQFETKGLMPSKRAAQEQAALTAKPGPDKTERLFQMPIFTGVESETAQMTVGPRTIHNSLYFIPLMLVYTGMRRAEAAGLSVNDIEKLPNGWAIEIRENKIRRLKKKQSERTLPVPPEMLRLNFLDYVEEIRSLGYDALFPELINPFKVLNADPGDRFYKNFMPLIVDNAANSGPYWDRALHALRHGNADTLKQNGVSPELIEDIHGRQKETETGRRYTNPAGMPLVSELLAKYPVVSAHLEAKPVELLSFVAAKEPAPWFEDPDKKRGRRGKRNH
ncbi:MAG: tyrosine-type recombinase/integrase [Roseibium sp.]|uniref:tyrosine-type recombinase/integrase n=1 Tax=Roseibium polysiphoniae TaxID=2571221 RepID=UPI0032975FC8